MARRALPLLVFLAAGAWQALRVAQDFGGRLVAKVWVNRRLDAVSRSADVSYGEDYRRYIDFLREGIPEEARAVILPTSGLPQYQSRSFLQYFLFPRDVVICTDDELEACIFDWLGSNTYFVYKGDLHLSPLARGEVQQVEFREGEGFLAPVVVPPP